MYVVYINYETLKVGMHQGTIDDFLSAENKVIENTGCPTPLVLLGAFEDESDARKFRDLKKSEIPRAKIMDRIKAEKESEFKGWVITKYNEIKTSEAEEDAFKKFVEWALSK